MLANAFSMSKLQHMAIVPDQVDAAWRKQATEWRLELGVAASYCPWQHLQLKAVGLRMNSRVKSLLDLVVTDVIVHYLQRNPKTAQKAARSRAWARKVMSGTVVDTSQNPGRRPFVMRHIGTMCTSSHLYHFGRDAVILPLEMLFLQGHPSRTEVPYDKMSATHARRLAGEGIALPCLALVVMSLLLTKGFPDP